MTPLFSKLPVKRKSLGERLLQAWTQWYRPFFFFLFFCFGVWSSFLWYHSLSFQWSDSQKREYKEQQSHRVELKEKELEVVLKMTEKQRSEYLNDAPVVKDIFSDTR